MNSVIGFDLGLHCGWAVYHSEKYTFGMECVKEIPFNKKTKQGQNKGARFLLFSEFLDKLFSHFDVDLVVYEEVRRHGGIYAAHAYGGFLAVLSLECEKRGLRYVGLPVKTIKKFATGDGNASKEKMLAKAEISFGTDEKPVLDEDAADALWVCAYGVEKLPHDTPQLQLEFDYDKQY